MYTTSACIISQIFQNVNTQNTDSLLYILYKYCVSLELLQFLVKFIKKVDLLIFGIYNFYGDKNDDKRFPETYSA